MTDEKKQKPKKEHPPAKAYGEGSVWLDPEDCGSLVAWHISRDTRSYTSGEILLTDCGRTIRWSFHATKAGVKKLVRLRAVIDEFAANFSRACRENPEKGDDEDSEA